MSLNSVFLQDKIVSVVSNVLTWLHDEMSMTRHAECHVSALSDQQTNGLSSMVANVRLWLPTQYVT